MHARVGARRAEERDGLAYGVDAGLLQHALHRAQVIGVAVAGRALLLPAVKVRAVVGDRESIARHEES